MTIKLRQFGLKNIIIRRATISDAATIFEVYVDAVTNLCAGHYSPEQIGRWFDGRSSQNYLSAIEHQALWIAERMGATLGYTEYFGGEVTSLFIRSEMSDLGLGSLLLNFAIQQIRKGHQGPIRVEATINGQQFYRKHGFVKVGESCLVRASGLRLETVLMERQKA